MLEHVQPFSLAADLDDVRDHFKIQRVMYYYKNRYNISPTQHTPIILHQDGERVLDEFRWGSFHSGVVMPLTQIS